MAFPCMRDATAAYDKVPLSRSSAGGAPRTLGLLPAVTVWAFSIGYFSRSSPVFMLFELDSYDQIRAIEFERRMGAVGGQLSDLIASQWRFNDASKIPLERRR